MGRRVNAVLHEAWRERIAQQAVSGLTVAAYCQQSGFSEHSFYSWRRRLSDSPPGVPSARQVDTNCSVSAPEGGGSPRTLDGRFIRLPLEIEGGYLEVVLTDATRVRVPAQHLAAWELTLQAVINRIGRHEAEARHV